MDPLADKVLVLGALFALVAAERFWIVPVALIAVRELAISVYRTQLGRQGLAVPARQLAKLKTVVQEFAVAFALFPLTGDTAWWPWPPCGWLWRSPGCRAPSTCSTGAVRSPGWVTGPPIPAALPEPPAGGCSRLPSAVWCLDAL